MGGMEKNVECQVYYMFFFVLLYHMHMTSLYLLRITSYVN